MTKVKITALALAALCMGGVVQAQKVKGVTEPEVTRLIKTLSDDDMQGRASFTAGGDKAADFIASEFAKTKLKPLPGEVDFKQTFKVYRVTPATLKVSLNGEELAADKIVASTSHQKLNWQNGGTTQVVAISETDDFREAFGRVGKMEADVLVLIHPKHSAIFTNYQRYLRRGAVLKDTGKGHSRVFALTELSAPSAYNVTVENNIENLQLTNVGAMIEGKRKNEYVVFSGHYDHIGIQRPLDGDSIANGADDDASGTTAMMMLAKHFKKQGKPERSILFVAFAAEEIGGYGSRHFSEQLNPDEIVAMYNIEMVGKPSKFGPNSAYLTGFERSNLGELMQKSLKGTTYSIHPDPYPEQNLFYRSDNATLARLGVPAHTISSVQIDQDKTYHTVNDEFEMLDMAHMTNMIKAIALASKNVVNGKETPTRVDKSQVQ
ncbi:M20/M25/M40 family metallo-hydrolase [uncultured Pontibacter sp.]|uniref:M20/M25/M40 family metallo-hydrolase n=1 Tax=uncultured Pontibacter sp. TaxID=453356 RepID=UPI002630F75E|nr:M20/M25/M40 family metallo-hydrolase [uncultured Pontibacter sp.]